MLYISYLNSWTDLSFYKHFFDLALQNMIYKCPLPLFYVAWDGNKEILQCLCNTPPPFAVTKEKIISE